jgi:hypothetical protein
VREGEAELHQQQAFAPLFVRKRQPSSAAGLAPQDAG